MAYAITLDVTHDEPTVDTALTELTNGLDVKAEVVNEAGPAGGWPEVKFTSHSEAELVGLIKRYEPDEAEHDTLASRIITT